jgi:anti-sigma regulatory factor (Ser/Thr protein kinase)
MLNVSSILLAAAASTSGGEPCCAATCDSAAAIAGDARPRVFLASLADDDAPDTWRTPEGRVIRVTQPDGSHPLFIPSGQAGAFVVGDDGESFSTARSVVVIRDENGELKIVNTDGDIQAMLDGEPLGADRVKVKDGTVLILDEEGNVIHEAKVGDHGAFAFGGAEIPAAGDEPPRKGRIGVMLGELDPTLAEHLGIDSEGAFVITDVMPGEPAEQAGVKKNDIVVRINGESASMERLVEVVGGSEPGSQVRLRVIRKGEPKDINVTVGRFEAQPFDVQVDVDTDEDGESDGEGMFRFDVEVDGEEGGFDPDRIREIIQKHMHEHMGDGQWQGALDRLRELPQLREFRFSPEQFEGFRMRLDDAMEQPFEFFHSFEFDGEHMKHIHEVIQNALEENGIGEDLREKIKAKIHEALKNAQGHWQGFGEGHGEGDGPMRFEFVLGEGGGEHHMVIIEEGGEPRVIRRRMGDGPMAVEVAPHAAAPANADDRLRALEARLARLEELLHRVAERLEDGGTR